MTGRRAAGIVVLTAIAVVLLVLVTIASDPWWGGPLAILGGVALAAVLVWAIRAVIDG